MNAVHCRSITIALVAGLAWSVAAPVLRAQSLADLAKKEEERRKTIPQPAKVYTNKDLSPVPPGSPTPPATAADGKTAAPDATDAAPPKAEADTKTEKKDQAYWASKLKALQVQLDRDSSFADALQVKINALTTDFVNRDDPAQRSKIEQERQKALGDLTRLKKAVADDNKAIADLHEQARREGVPPGWLR